MDRHKIDPETSDLQGLADQLGHYLTHNFAIQHSAISIEGVRKADDTVDLYLLIAEVPQDSWPAVLALSDSQKAPLYLCEISDDGSGKFVLTPLGKEGV
ncbi:MAG: hypothetical protein LBV12_05375 [Puniceicoccales bacterium]|nr:hypothetical protein [Puniceicoccales bacterium]